MITTLRVLSVGSPESNDFVRDVLLSRTRCRLVAATCAWDLSTILASVAVDVAILHDALSASELRSCAGYIRHHWRCASILLISARTDLLDDALYEERLEPGSAPERLLRAIEQLAAYARRKRRFELSRERGS